MNSHRLFHLNKKEEELEKELSFHLDLHTSDLIAQGYSPEEARRQARLALGGPEQVKEMCRDVRWTRWLRDLLQDLRYGVRVLAKQPWFTAVAVLALGLGHRNSKYRERLCPAPAARGQAGGINRTILG